MDTASIYFNNFVTKAKKGIDASSKFTTETFQSVKNYTDRCQKVILMTGDFFLGTGQENRTFINDEIANSFSDAWRVNETRDFFYKCVNEGRDVLTDPIAKYKAPFGLKGLYKAGFDPVEQFVGTYRIVDIIVINKKFIQFKLTNRTSANSLMYDKGPLWSRSSFKPLGNIEQTYIFTESINFSKVKNTKYLKP